MRGAAPYIVLAAVLMAHPQALALLVAAYLGVLVARAWE